MRHKNKNRKFGLKKNQRIALMKSLAYSLFSKGKIKTNEAKAKELRPYAEKLITLGKKANLASHRLLISKVGKLTADKVFKEMSPKYKERNGGYTRITKLPARISDGSKMAIIEFV